MQELPYLLKDLADDSFDPAMAAGNGLTLLFGDAQITVCVTDLTRARVVAFQQYVLSDNANPSGSTQDHPDQSDILSRWMTRFPFRNHPFNPVRIVFEDQRSSLIPEPLFEPDEVVTFLEFNCGQMPGEKVLFNRLPSAGAYQVYGVPEDLMTLFHTLYPGQQPLAASSVFIESIWINYKGRMSAPGIFVNLRYRSMDLMIFDGQQMLFYNCFNHQCAEDIVYYIIFVLEQLNLNPEQVPLVLFGETEEREGLYDLLFNYIRHIEFGRQTGFFRFSQSLAELPAHEHFILFGTIPCGL